MATLVLDNGASSAKIGYSSEKVSVIPNCQFRSKTSRLKTFTANQLDEIKDPSGLFYILPFQKGYLVNWDVQRKVWDHLFGKEMFKVEFADTSIVITEPYFNFSSIQESMNEILFEEYQFQSVLRINTGSLSAHHFFHSKPPELCCLVVDSGFSFTHIAPYCRNKKMKEGIRRINVGGKLLTNHLKEIISYRQLHVMDETHVINQVKEDVCYVSQHFYKDMEISQMKGEENTVVRDYVLPDFSSIKKGFCKPREEMVFSGKYKTGEQILRLANERFAVPEMLFHPSDIGIQEMGIPEAIVHSIQSLPEEMQPHFYQNIVLTGGNTLFPGYRERLEAELRSLAPAHLPVSVLQPEKNEVQSMLDKFGADISKVMQAKRKRLESLTKNYMKGSQHKLEQLWSTHHNQRQRMTQQYSQQVSTALQQWEAEAQRAEEQEEQLNSLFRQQQKILQQARVVQKQKLQTVRELYEQFVKNMDDMEKSHDAFLQGAQQELKKEMATLQKKILMDTQQQEMATVRKSLQSMLF